MEQSTNIKTQESPAHSTAEEGFVVDTSPHLYPLDAMAGNPLWDRLILASFSSLFPGTGHLEMFGDWCFHNGWLWML